MNDLLLQLQAADTEADQLRHRRARVPERDALADAERARAEWVSAGDAMRARIEQLTEEIATEEQESATLDQQRARLAGQLRTVIAPREAEALQHQIALLDERRSQLDDRELAALEEQSEIDDRLTEHAGREAAIVAAVDEARSALDAVEASIDADIAVATERAESLRGQLPEQLLVRYDRLRGLHGGVAIAKLVGNRCDGCHLDLSAAEAEAVRHTPAGDLADCPQCGRMLVP
ncbi:MAG: C4-type zinc ribbon domain-containing protein [Ilumatobacteraceae bacterium]|jgi:hypothetical protein|nr:C4-type zinc ribbon domain-containing protein [Ilumatobacteraceae bacterium]